MRLAFSTLSCPTWTLEQIVQAALDWGYAGVEVRGLGPHVENPLPSPIGCSVPMFVMSM